MSVLRSRRFALLLASSALIAGLAACGGGGSSSGTPANSDPNGWNAVTKLTTTDTVVGTGATATAGTKATVTYTGWLYDVRVANTKGTQFDTGSFTFPLGASPLQVIAGFDQGVNGMKVGGTRTVTIPASLAYGNSAYGSIPANAALVFDITLTAVN